MKFFLLSGMHLPDGYTRQIWRTMKLTFILLTAFFLHVSATTLAQQVTLKKDRITLKQAFTEIRKQTGFVVLYGADEVDVNKTVTLNLDHVALKDAMTKILESQNLDFTIEDQSIVIKKKEASAIDELKAQVRREMAQVTVTARVTDELGSPMPGVTIKQKDNTSNGTVSDAKGVFSLPVPNDNTVFVFSYIGYETQELRAKDIQPGSAIKLKASETNLQEVVVDQGYYSRKQELNTGNVSIVTAKTIEEQPVTDPIMALEGRVPGLQIVQSSGIPGAAETVRIRGQNSIANGNDPLYIVDGVPMTSTSLSSTHIDNGAVGSPNGGAFGPQGLSPFNALNPADIESIEVLKDADATAIYGSRGANGVILITTKKGKAGDTKADVNVTQGVGQVGHMMDLMNTQQYLAMRHQAFANDGTSPGNSDYDLNGAWDTTRYTNWQKVLIGNTAQYTNAYATLSGGNTNTQFLIGGGYSRQTTVYPGNYSDDKGSLHISLNHTSSDQKFHAVFSAQYVADNNVIPDEDFTNSITIAPNAPELYNPNGTLNWQNNTFTNPVAGTANSAKSVTDNLIGNLNLSYQILPGLQLSSNFGYTHMEMNQSTLLVSASVQPPASSRQRRNNYAVTNLNTWIAEPQIDYNRQIGKGKLDILLGSSFQENYQNTIGIIGLGYSSDALVPDLLAAPTIIPLGQNITDYKYQALYARVNYDLEDKYVLNFTARRDGSSRFGPGNQFGNFGAGGATWIFSKEKGVEDALPWLSFGKLRGSYGVTGNDQIGDYQYLSTYTTYTNSTYQGVSTLYPTYIGNPGYHWEVVKKLEGAIDFGFLKDRINLTVDYYRNRTDNQLIGEPLPSYDGFTSVIANLPAAVQNTGLEMELNTTNIKSKSFTWTSSFNLSFPRNKLVSFPGLASNDNYRYMYAIGQSLSARPTYKYTGINPQTGLYTVQDVNGDGQLDYTDQQFLSQVAQNYAGGLQNSFTYKNWSLDLFIQFVKQTGYNPYLDSFTSGLKMPGTFNNNEPIAFINNLSIQKFSTSYGTDAGTAWSNYKNSNAAIVDASYVRLKNIALAYSLPNTWQKSMHLRNAKIFLQGQNLLTITPYKGLDPETQGLTLPPLRIMTIGVSASL